MNAQYHVCAVTRVLEFLITCEIEDPVEQVIMNHEYHSLKFKIQHLAMKRHRILSHKNYLAD
jgi:hypothetical protein